MRPIATTLLVLTAVSLSAQPTTGSPVFEAATVKPNKSGVAGGDMSGTQFTVRNATLGDLLKFAYDVQESAMVGSPGWFWSDRFDVIAKKPADAPASTTVLMVRSLLSSEFKLVLHEEQRPQDVYALEVAKSGSKLRKSDGTAQSDCKPSGEGYLRRLQCTNVTMADLVDNLRRKVPTALIDHPLVDRTGIPGTWDLTLEWVMRFDPETGKPSDEEGGTTLRTSLSKVGLSLELRRIPQPVIVIDHAERIVDAAR